MTTVTENDIKELKDLITAMREENRERFTSIENGQKALEIAQAVASEKLTSINERLDIMQSSVNKIPDLAEKVGELKNWKQAGVVIITAFISSILSSFIGGVIGWLIRSAKINP